MTRALKAMVAAMIEEISRQAYTDYSREEPNPEPFINDLLIDGHVDLEKVARAGLEAIRNPGQDIVDVGDGKTVIHFSPEEGEGLDSVDTAPAWAAMIDAILKDGPARG